MIITRKFGKLIRRRATPFHIFPASILGMLIGFAPGFQQAPELLIFWIGCLIILNANLFLASLVRILGILLSIALMPVAFATGRFLFGGPTNPLFASLGSGHHR